MRASNQFYNELHNLITRWGHESDITRFEVIGAIEAAKADLLQVVVDPLDEDDENSDDSNRE